MSLSTSLVRAAHVSSSATIHFRALVLLLLHYGSVLEGPLDCSVMIFIPTFVKIRISLQKCVTRWCNTVKVTLSVQNIVRDLGYLTTLILLYILERRIM